MTNKKKKDDLQVTEITEPIAVESATFESALRANLEEIRNYDGVVGYILQNTTSASIDLKDPAKIIDYAILSSTTFDSTEELSETFQPRRCQRYHHQRQESQNGVSDNRKEQNQHLP